MTGTIVKPKGMPAEVWALMLECYGQGGYRTAGNMKVALLQAVREGKIDAVDIPNERAMYRHLERLSEFYVRQPVGLRDIPIEHSAYVLSVLAAVLEETEGRVSQFSRAEVDWIIRVHAAASELSPWQVYKYALEYWTRDLAGDSTVTLDLTLAFAPWKDEWARLMRAMQNHWMPKGTYPTSYPGRLLVKQSPDAGPGRDEDGGEQQHATQE